jgi:hypothetical protein
MHYIIGTGFNIPSAQQQTVRPSVVTSINAGSTSPNIAREWNDFESGHTYILYNIQKIEDTDKLKYTFSSQTGAAPVEKLFENAAQGDAYISSIRREQLPDYDTFYTNRND